MRNMENAIEVTNMSKRFKLMFDRPNTLKERIVFFNHEKPEYHQVLQDINLEIKKGESVALIGTNGSGKSTLLKLMTKILYPNKGKIETNGKLTSLLELGAGFHPDFTGRENIYFNASIFGLTKSEIDNRIDSIIDFAELGEFIDNPVRTYSSGMYMRLAFSVAINVDAEILLIDEILGVGDQYFQEKCFKKLEELRDSDKTIVIVSHSLDVVKKLCPRSVWIYKGHLKEDGDSETVIRHYLDRIVEDHKKSKGLVIKKDKYFGDITIDCPQENQTILLNSLSHLFYGWELSETDESIVKVYLDDSYLGDAIRVERDDVTTLLGDQFGGYAANPQPGWKFAVNESALIPGKHELKVQSMDEHGQIIKEKSVHFNCER